MEMAAGRTSIHSSIRSLGTAMKLMANIWDPNRDQPARYRDRRLRYRLLALHQPWRGPEFLTRHQDHSDLDGWRLA